MNASRRPPIDDLAKRVATESVGKALKSKLPIDDAGLGAVGEEAFGHLIDQADRDEANHRTLMKFAPWWRTFIRGVDEEDITVLREIIDAHKQRKAMRAFWAKTWKWAVPVAGAAYGYSVGFFEKAWPFIQKIAKALAETPPT